MITVSIRPQVFSPDAELARFTAVRDAGAGAAVTFVGYCRGESQEGDVTRLDLEHYPGFTEKEIDRLARRVADRHVLAGLLVIHRFGPILPGEPIVLVAALSAHRAAAFAAVEELMDFLKTDAPFWKREIGPNGARWIEPTAEDRRRREEHSQ
jgi:molybdopterin synthase catalytic subunit